MDSLTAEQTTPALSWVDQILRATSIAAAVSVPVSSFIAEFVIGGGGVLHVGLAVLSSITGGAFLLRRRGRPSPSRVIVTVASAASLAWLAGVTSLALLYGWMMKDFH